MIVTFCAFFAMLTTLATKFQRLTASKQMTLSFHMSVTINKLFPRLKIFQSSAGVTKADE